MIIKSKVENINQIVKVFVSILNGTDNIILVWQETGF